MKELNPLQNIFTDINKIIQQLIIKNKQLADSYETIEYRNDAEMYLNALNGYDTYISYLPFWTIAMFQKVQPNIKINFISFWMKNPYNVPLQYRETLLKEGREAFLKQYQEKNAYYRTLNGLPPLTDETEDFIYLSPTLANALGSTTEIPVHLLPVSVQDKFLNTTEFDKAISKNKLYLQYIGSKKIDIYTARQAKDFEIIRYPLDRYDINPNLLVKFKETYDAYRNYVVEVLYNKKMEENIPHYRDFMGLLIMFYTLLQLANSCTEALNDFEFLDDTTIYLIFSMYGLPDVSITASTRRKIVKNILKLIQNKGTLNIYYELISLLGYKETKVNQLYLMKSQKFDSQRNYEASSGSNVFFLENDIKSKDLYKEISKVKQIPDNYFEITNSDDEWINDNKVLDIINNQNYSISNSKYISLSSSIEQNDYLFESIYLLRFLLDEKPLTSVETIQIPELFGTEEFSLYDITIALVAGVCRLNKLSGIIDKGNVPLAVAGFNTDINLEKLDQFVNSSKFIDKSKIELFKKNLYVNKMIDINRIYNDIIIPMRDWIKYKITNSVNKDEFNEYEKLYKAIFTYDIDKTKLLDDYKKPIKAIQDYFQISDEDFEAFLNFYPHFIADGTAATVENFYQSSYSLPFVSLDNEVTFKVSVNVDTDEYHDPRGNLYFYDILNSENSMKLTNSYGMRIFMDIEDDHWVINDLAILKAIEEIENLSDDELGKAFFQIKTPILNTSKTILKGTLLPESIRNKGIFKKILIEKLKMDAVGFAEEPETFNEVLYSRNKTLFNFIQSDLFEENKELWTENLMKIVLALETNLDLYLKYFEHSVVGPDLFFKPLILLINYFKSVFIKLIKTNLTYLINEKVDAGGNSNLVKLFEAISVTRYLVILAKKGYNSQFGLFDAEKSSKFKAVINDYSMYLEKRKILPGSLRMTDEAKFFKNGESIDPTLTDKESLWFIGESGTGRWSDEDDFIMKTRFNNQRLQKVYNFDFKSWKWFVESYIK